MRRLATGLLPRSCLLRLVAQREGKGCAVAPAGPAAGAGEVLQGVRVEVPEPVGGDSLIIERVTPQLSESRAGRQGRRSSPVGSSLRSRSETAHTRPSPSHST